MQRASYSGYEKQTNEQNNNNKKINGPTPPDLEC